jgi:hypothetical protein
MLMDLCKHDIRNQARLCTICISNMLVKVKDESKKQGAEKEIRKFYAEVVTGLFMEFDLDKKKQLRDYVEKRLSELK